MSDAVQDQMVDQGEITESTDSAVEQTVSIEELQAKVDMLDDFARKNREENANYRAQNRKLKEQLQSIEKAKQEQTRKNLEKNGEYKALWEQERQRAEDLNRSLEHLTFERKAEKTSGKFKEIASSHGCNDPSIAFVMANNKYQTMMDFEADTLEASEQSMVAVVEKLKLDHPTLFKSGPLQVKDGQAAKVKSGPKPFDELDNNELAKLLADQLKGQSY